MCFIFMPSQPFFFSGVKGQRKKKKRSFDYGVASLINLLPHTLTPEKKMVLLLSTNNKKKMGVRGAVNPLRHCPYTDTYTDTYTRKENGFAPFYEQQKENGLVSHKNKMGVSVRAVILGARLGFVKA